MKSQLSATATSILAIATALGLSPAIANPSVLVGQWEGSSAVSVATVVNGAVEFTAVSRTKTTRTPWTKVVATVTSQNDSTISLSTRTYIGRNATPAKPATYNAATDTITFANNVVWTRKFDPNLAKLKEAEIQSQLDAANQRARDLENQMNQNRAVNAQTVETLQSDLARLMTAQQASDAQRAALAKTLEDLQTKAEQKNIIPADSTITVAQSAPPTPGVPVVGKTLRVFCEAGYVATFHARWVNKDTLEVEEWNSGRLAAGQRSNTVIPDGARNMEVWAIRHSFTNDEIFRTKEVDLNKEYKVYGTIFSSQWTTQ